MPTLTTPKPTSTKGLLWEPPAPPPLTLSPGQSAPTATPPPLQGSTPGGAELGTVDPLVQSAQPAQPVRPKPATPSPGPGWVQYGEGWVPPNHPLVTGVYDPPPAPTAPPTFAPPASATQAASAAAAPNGGDSDGPAVAAIVDALPLASLPYLNTLRGFDHNKLGNANHMTIKYQLGRLFAQYPPTPQGMADLVKNPAFQALGVQSLGGGNIKLPDGAVIDVIANFQNGGGSWWWGDSRDTGGATPAPGGSGGGGAPGPGTLPYWPPGGGGAGSTPGYTWNGTAWVPVPGGAGAYVPGSGTPAPGTYNIPGYGSTVESNEFTDPTTANLEALLNWRINELINPVEDPSRQQYADLLQQYVESLSQTDPAITNMVGALETQAANYLQPTSFEPIAQEQLNNLQGMPAGYQSALDRLMSLLQQPSQGETMASSLGQSLQQMPAGYEASVDALMQRLSRPAEGETMASNVARGLQTTPAAYQSSLDALMQRLANPSEGETLASSLGRNLQTTPAAYQSSLDALMQRLANPSAGENLASSLGRDFQSVPAEYQQQAAARIAQLQADPYTGAEWEMYRTGTLDPIERDRKAAQDRITAEIAQRGLDPSSGIAQQMRIEADRTFDQSRAVEQGNLGRARVEQRQARQGEAFDIQSALQSLLQSRQLQGLTMQTAADEMGLSRAQGGLSAQTGAEALQRERQAQGVNLQTTADQLGLARAQGGVTAQTEREALQRARQAQGLGMQTTADEMGRTRAQSGLTAQSDAEALQRARDTQRSSLAQNLADWTSGRGERAAQLYAQLAEIPNVRAQQQLQGAQTLSGLSQSVRSEEQTRRAEALALQGLLAELPERRLQLALATLGEGSSPESMLGSLTGLAGIANQSQANAAAQSQANWTGLGSLASILAGMFNKNGNGATVTR